MRKPGGWQLSALPVEIPTQGLPGTSSLTQMGVSSTSPTFFLALYLTLRECTFRVTAFQEIFLSLEGAPNQPSRVDREITILAEFSWNNCH